MGHSDSQDGQHPEAGPSLVLSLLSEAWTRALSLACLAKPWKDHVPPKGPSKFQEGPSSLPRALLMGSSCSCLLMTVSSLYPHMAGWEQAGWEVVGEVSSLSLLHPLIRALILFMRAPPLCPNHLPKTPPPNTVTLKVSILTYEFGGTQTFNS